MSSKQTGDGRMTRSPSFAASTDTLVATVEAETVEAIVAYLESQRPNLDKAGTAVRAFADGMDVALANAIEGIKRGDWRKESKS